MSIAVVIPTLDEAGRIGGLVRRLRERRCFAELIVADGGSRDATVDRAEAAGARVIRAPRGRGVQLNAGAAAAGAEVLFFLHADTLPPPGAAAQIRSALSAPGAVAGAFKTWTVPDGGDSPPWLGPMLHLADIRSRYTGLPYGDQGLFVRAATFREVGGFPEIPILEDLELSRRLAARGRIVRAPGRIRVSGRRFARRPAYYFALMNLCPLLYRLGVPPERLARAYGVVR